MGGEGESLLQGQVAVTASIDFTLANHVAAMILLGKGVALTHSQLLGVYAGLFLLELTQTIADFSLLQYRPCKQA